MTVFSGGLPASARKKKISAAKRGGRKLIATRMESNIFSKATLDRRQVSPARARGASRTSLHCGVACGAYVEPDSEDDSELLQHIDASTRSPRMLYPVVPMQAVTPARAAGVSAHLNYDDTLSTVGVATRNTWRFGSIWRSGVGGGRAQVGREDMPTI